jgi:hypothetical protein
MRHTAETLIASEQTFAEDLSDALARVNASKREDGEFILLATIKELVEAFKATESANLTPEARIARDLVEIAWMKLFEIYYWLSDRDQSHT